MTLPDDPDFESQYSRFREKIAEGLADADAGRLSDGERFFDEVEEQDPETDVAIDQGWRRPIMVRVGRGRR